MEIRLLNKSFTPVAVIDVFMSFIWTDRFYEYGDFELKLPIDLLPSKMTIGNYLTYDKSEHTMIIESLQYDRNADDGNIVTVSGRSLESLLDRRAVYECVRFNGGLEEYAEMLLNNAIISPQKSYRKIDNFLFEASGIKTVDFEAQHQGNLLYDVISSLCKDLEVGWKITVKDGNLVFQLYSGKNHSASGTSGLKTVLFSENMNNVSSVQYLESTTDYKNAALIMGEENDDTGRTYTDVNADDNAAGLERREVVVECSASRSTVDDNGEIVDLSDSEYINVLKTSGRDELSQHKVTRTANGGIDAVNGQYRYGTDFDIGDLVTIDTALADAIVARVVETTFSEDETGFEQYNSFETVDLN